ncbi:MAG: SxtJ family membrane protein [Deltaproteobacteria bacterium]|nr:SxtJ family membrane protein [Deltaproteobacteria bacterium]
MKRFLKVIYAGWMKFAHILGWVNTRIILTLVYLIIFTPLALIFRLIGKDPMDRRLEKGNSYWVKREQKVFRQEDYRRQF